jgi:hypothetical protein
MEIERAVFEKWVRDAFVCGEHSFVRAHPYGYINTVSSQTYGGREQPRYSDVQMLWDTWRAASVGVQRADDFKPDWSELEAARASLREHMRMAKVLLTQIKDLRRVAAPYMGDHPEIRAADAVIAHYEHPGAIA